MNPYLKELEAFADLLAACNVIHESAVHDAEDYDGEETLCCIAKAHSRLMAEETAICESLKRVRDDWQQLANSPRDGTVFMAYVPHNDPRAGGFQFVAVWNLRDRLLCMMSGDDFTNKATLWRAAYPLPENDQVELPPNGGSESTKGVVGG